MKSYRSVTVVAEEILANLGTPLHYKDLTRRILSTGDCKLQGKTPHETVRSRISTTLNFVRVAEGTYALREWSNYLEIRFAKDIAYDILSRINRPMTIDELGSQIIQERFFIGGKRQVVRNVLHSDKRFFFDKDTKKVSLVVWR